VAHRASRSELLENEIQAERFDDFESAPLQISSARSRMTENKASDLVRSALEEHLRQTNELAARLRQALMALDSPFGERALSA
jgi:ferritin-like metal-binding protein YciE